MDSWKAGSNEVVTKFQSGVFQMFFGGCFSDSVLHTAWPGRPLRHFLVRTSPAVPAKV